MREAIAAASPGDSVEIPTGTYTLALGEFVIDKDLTLQGAGAVDSIIQASTDNAIQSNSIFSNTGLGIDLASDGVTRNDAGDADSGANNLQNVPVLTLASSVVAAIMGPLNSTSNTEFRLEFFSNGVCDPYGHGEGASFLGSTAVTTGNDGTANFSFTVQTLPVGE